MDVNFEDMFKDIYGTTAVPPRSGATVPELIENMKRNINVLEKQKQK